MEASSYTKAALHNGMKFRAVFEMAPSGIAVVDLAGRPVDVNPALCDFLDYTVEELRRMTFDEFTYPADLVTDRRFFNELVEGRRDRYSMTKRYIAKTGAIVWAHLSVSLIRDDKADPTFVIATVQPVSHADASSVLLAESVDAPEKVNLTMGVLERLGSVERPLIVALAFVVVMAGIWLFILGGMNLLLER